MSRVSINYKLKSPAKRRVMKKHIKRFLKYMRKPSNEFGFLFFTLQSRFHPDILPVNMYIDDNGSWTNLGDKKILLFQTNKDKYPDFNKMLPMTIENEPEILVKNEKIDLTESEIEQIKNFVIKYQKPLIEIGCGNLDHLEFNKILRTDGIHLQDVKISK